MSFFDTVHKIQKKPEHVKKRILALIVAAIMAVIIFLWFNNLKYSLSKEEKQNQPSPFSIFKETILKGIRSIKEL